MALAADGRLWGCTHYPEYFKGKEGTEEYHKYCFGTLDSFIDNHNKVYPEALSNYSKLCIFNFYTDENSCIQCPELDECDICPIDGAFSSSFIGKIPEWKCKIKKILRREKNLLLKEFENNNIRMLPQESYYNKIYS